MSKELLLKKIDQIAKLFIALDESADLKEIGELYDLLTQLTKDAESEGPDALFSASKIAEDKIRSCILDEGIKRSDIFNELADIISKMQYMLFSNNYDNIIIKENISLDKLSPQETNKSKKNYHLPVYLDQHIFHEFLNEQVTVLEKIESHILKLEKGYDKETFGELKRIFHTLKGESSIFELFEVQKLCHMTEDVIDCSAACLPIDTLLRVKDWLENVFNALRLNTEPPILDEPLLMLLCIDNRKNGDDTKIFARQETNTADAKNIKTTNNCDSDGKLNKYLGADIDLLTDFVSEAQEHIDNIDSKLLLLEKNPADVDLLNAVFRVFHTIKGAAGFLALDDIAHLAHSTENLLDAARKGDLQLADAKMDIVFESLDTMKKIIANVKLDLEKGIKNNKHDIKVDTLVERIVGITSKPSNKNNQTMKETNNNSFVIPSSGSIEEGYKKIAEDENNKTNLDSSSGTTTMLLSTRIKEAIKVDSENLDKLIDAIGELVIIESMIQQDSEISNITSSKLLRNMSQMNKITRELQQIGMSLRMVPVKATFQKMARVVRDLSKKSSKRIEFITSGEDTMLDKSVVDRIGDPLIHLVRNCVDHGIEKTAEERIKKGKPECARIELHAFHNGGHIYLDVRDDGKGLNKSEIVKKAIEKGLARKDQALADNEIYNFIFLPGFSTAKKVTDVSGRGVGMDVVKRTIADLRGNIEINSEDNIGTTFSIRLPLTLAIIDGMLVLTGSERFIIPTLSIVKAIKPKAEDILTIAERGEMVRLRDNLVPMYRLSSLFDINDAKKNAEEAIVIVVEDSGKLAAILVDELLGQQSTVIKSLGATLKGLPGISGGSIMSDGKVGIIVDVGGIIALATNKNRAHAKMAN